MFAAIDRSVAHLTRFQPPTFFVGFRGTMAFWYFVLAAAYSHSMFVSPLVVLLACLGCWLVGTTMHEEDIASAFFRSGFHQGAVLGFRRAGGTGGFLIDVPEPSADDPFADLRKAIGEVPGGVAMPYPPSRTVH